MKPGVDPWDACPACSGSGECEGCEGEGCGGTECDDCCGSNECRMCNGTGLG